MPVCLIISRNSQFSLCKVFPLTAVNSAPVPLTTRVLLGRFHNAPNSGHPHRLVLKAENDGDITMGRVIDPLAGGMTAEQDNF